MMHEARQGRRSKRVIYNNVSPLWGVAFLVAACIPCALLFKLQLGSESVLSTLLAGATALLGQVGVFSLIASRLGHVITRDFPAGHLRIDFFSWQPYRVAHLGTYRLSDIRDVIVETKLIASDSNGEHRVVLVLNTGKHVPLTEEYSSNRKRQERFAHNVRTLLDRPSS